MISGSVGYTEAEVGPTYVAMGDLGETVAVRVMTELDSTLQRLIFELRNSAIALRQSVMLLQRAEEADAEADLHEEAAQRPSPA